MTDSASPTPVAVIGCGRMGRLHARVYSEMPRAKLVGVFDVHRDKAAEVARDYRCEPVTDLDALLPRIRAVTIAVPTQFHREIAEPFLARGIACLIEKPLAANTEQCRAIVETAQEHRAVLQVGHVERFNPVIRALSRLDIQPRFIEATRISPMTFRSIDVGVVLDMMIHDIDIVLKLAGSPVERVEATGVSVIGEVEDICNTRVTFANGCVANLTGSRLSLKTERRLRIFSAEAYVSIDYQKKRGILVRRTGNLDAIRTAVKKVREGQLLDPTQMNFGHLIKVEEMAIEDVEPLRAEQEAFLDAATGAASPVVTGEDGLRAVELAERIVAAVGPTTL
jgi:predicted dehydrogenase